MKINSKSAIVFCLFAVFCSAAVKQPPELLTTRLAVEKTELTTEQKLLLTMHSISSETIFEYIKELSSEEYAGRLTGTKQYNASAQYVISHFKKWAIKSAVKNDTYLQPFSNPYTLVFPPCEVSLHLPQNGSVTKKQYRFDEEFIPGSTSGSGTVTERVIYVGYGISAPELGYDDYQSVDVAGKIVLMEREVPVSDEDDHNLFIKWRPYSFHQYKLKNAVAHGAAGMLYNYGPIANPNNAYEKNFIYSHVGPAVVADIFAGTGRMHKQTVEQIKTTHRPASFNTGKTVTIKNNTEHHPEGIGYNVIGILEGCDPALKDQVLIIGGHLDHLGRCYETMPGANDNASAVAVIMSLAEALSKSHVKPRRSVMFLCFGAEEQGVAGSKYYLNNPIVPLKKTVCLINMDSVGSGDKLAARAAKNYPVLWKFFEAANDKYIHRVMEPTYYINLARPRLDAARFLWKKIPTISFKSYESPPYYHTTKDNISIITPEIAESLAQLLFITVLDIANQDTLDLTKDAPEPLFVPSDNGPLWQ